MDPAYIFAHNNLAHQQYTTGFIEVQNAEKDVAGRESLHRTPRRLTTAFGLAALPIDELHEMKTIC